MPLDSQIPLAFRPPQIESPLAQYGQMVQLYNLMQQQKQQQESRRVLSESGGDVDKALTALIQSGNAEGASKLAPLLKLRQEAALREQMLKGGGNQQDPQFWFNLATVTGKPEYATHGERLQKLLDERKSMDALKSQIETPVEIGQASTEQEAIDRIRAGGGRPMTIGVGHEPGPEWSRTTKTGGALASLMQSPIPAISQAAKALQQRIDTNSIPLQTANTAITNLFNQETSLINQREMQADRLATKGDAPPVAVINPVTKKPEYVSRGDAIGREPASLDPNTQGAVAGAKVTGREMAEREMNYPEATKQVKIAVENIDALTDQLTVLRDHKGLKGITGWLYGRTPSTTKDSMAAQAIYENIVNNIFVNALQSMRAASKTGGAVGNVSDREGDRLQQTLAALSRAQGTDDFKAQAKLALHRLAIAKKNIQDAYNDTYSYKTDGWKVER